MPPTKTPTTIDTAIEEAPHFADTLAAFQSSQKTSSLADDIGVPLIQQGKNQRDGRWSGKLRYGSQNKNRVIARMGKMLREPETYRDVDGVHARQTKLNQYYVVYYRKWIPADQDPTKK